MKYHFGLAVFVVLTVYCSWTSGQTILSGPPWKVIGTLDSNSKTWNQPQFNDSQCLASPVSSNSTNSNTTGTNSTTTENNARYDSFRVVLNKDIFARALLLFTKDLQATGTLFVYSGAFDPNDPCKNFLVGFPSTGEEGLSVEIVGKLRQGTYWFVVSENTQGSTNTNTTTTPGQNDFVFNMFSANYEGTITNQQPTWMIPSPTTPPNTLITAQNNATCNIQNQNTNDTAHFFATKFIANQQFMGSDGRTDILVYLQTQMGGILDQPVVAVYEGDVLSKLQSNNGQALNPCTTLQNVPLLGVVKGNLNDLTTRLTAVLTSGATYTVIVSGNDLNDLGNVGIFIEPSVVVDFSHTGYILPNLNSANCTESGTTANWDFREFTARYPRYLISAFAGNSTITSLTVVVYASDLQSLVNSNTNNTNTNTTTTTNSTSTGATTPPPTCTSSFLVASDVLANGPLVLNVTDGQKYTIIIASANVDQTQSPVVLLYALGGQLAGTNQTQATVSPTGNGQPTISPQTGLTDVFPSQNNQLDPSSSASFLSHYPSTLIAALTCWLSGIALFFFAK